MTANLLRDGCTQPQGRLPVNVPSLFGRMLMGRLAAQFKAAYPGVTLEVTIEDREVTLASEGYDLVSRANPKPDSELVGFSCQREQLLVVAAPTLTRQQSVAVVVRNSARNTARWQFAGVHHVRDAVRTGIEAFCECEGQSVYAVS